MTTHSSSSPNILLLVEDNPTDAERFIALLAPNDDEYQLVHMKRVDQAVVALRSRKIDIVVLDLSQPARGVASIQCIRSADETVPIVVMTGRDEDSLARECLEAGAQDYLSKVDLSRHALKRALGYAITRTRDTHVRELKASMERYRALSTSTQSTIATAARAGSGVISMRSKDVFDELVRSYTSLVKPFFTEGDRAEVTRSLKESVVTRLGDANGGPRDLLDIHVAALDRAVTQGRIEELPRPVVLEARLLALELMGLLVDYYRVGYRRRFVEGDSP